MILVAADPAFAQTVTLSTSATNGTNLGPIPFHVVFDNPEHVLEREDLAVQSGNQRLDRDFPSSVTIPTLESGYIGTFNTLGSGDGQFNYPRAIAVNGTGHIYVADSNNNRIQIFDLAGNYISQFGIGNPHAIATSATQMFITDTTNHRIQIFDHSGNYISQFGSGPGKGNGTFNSPKGIAVNSTHIFVLDADNHRIQIFEHDGTYVDKFGSLGQGDHQFVRPSAIAVNSANIFVADFYSDEIKIFSLSGNWIESFDHIHLDGPSAITIHENNIYVASQNNGRVISFAQNGDGDYIGTIDTRFNSIRNHPAPSAIAFDSERIYVADGQRHHVFIDRKGWSFTVVGQGTSEIVVWININNPTNKDSNRIYLTLNGTRPTLTISNPIDITNLKNIPFIVKANEPITNLEISDITSSQGTVQNLRAPIEYYDTGLSITGGFSKGQIAVNATGYIYATNPHEDYVEIYDPYGNRVSTLNHPLVAGLKTGFDDAQGIAINGTGYIYVTDTAHQSIHIFDPQNQHVSYFGTHGSSSSDPGKFARPTAVETNSTGYVFVVDSFNNRVQILGPSGNYLDHFGGDGPGRLGKGSGDGQFSKPRDLALNSTGYIYVADSGNNRVQIFDPSGNYVGQFNSAGDDSFETLRSIVIDSDDNVYVADIGNPVPPETLNIIPDPTCVQGVPPGGTLADYIICTVRIAPENAGIHKFGPSGNYLGDLDIVGTDKIAVPHGIHFDSNGDTYVADAGNDQIYIERDGFTFEVVNVQNGLLSITIPANSVTNTIGNKNTQFVHYVDVSINPDPPTNLIATPGNDQVTLSWTAPANTYGTVITDYIVERSTGGSWVTVSDGVSADTFTTVTGLTNGVTYQFRVHAINSIGPSLLSNVASATPNPAPAVPGVPIELAATAGNGIVTLSWTAPDPNRSPLTDYTIQYKLNTATSWTTFNDGTVNQTSTIITGLTNGVPYQFRVAATNGIGTGLFSSPFDFTIPSTIDTVRPSVVISAVSPDSTNPSSIPFTVSFSENVTGFEASDVSVSSGTVTNLVGSFTGFFGELGSNDGQFNSPRGIAVNSTGHIFVLEDANSRIQILEIIDGEIRHAANFDISPFNDPQRMTMNSTGHIFVTDKGSHGIHVLDPAGKYLTHLGTQGDENDEFDGPVGIIINGTDHIYVVDSFNERIKILDSSGKYLDQIDDNSTGDGRLTGPQDIAINSTGHIFVTDFSSERVQIFNSIGHLVGTFGTPGNGNGQFTDPMGIAINGEDHIYVADRNNNRVQIFDSNGNYQSQFNGQGSGDDTLRWPTAIALDSVGGVYVTNISTRQIYVERDTHTFEVQNPGNGRLAVSIPAGSVQDSTGNGNTASNTVTVTVTGSSVVVPTVTAPGVPTGLTATAGNTQVDLSWTAPSDTGGRTITDYKIEYRTSGGSWTVFNDGTSTSTSATVIGLTNGQAYQFRISATNNIGTGSASNVVSATPTVTVQATAPSTPTNLSATAGNGIVTLSWTAPDNGGSAITRYNIEQSTDGTTWTASTPATSTGTTVTVTGLTNDQNYHFRVSATNSIGTGSASNTAQATPTVQSTQPVQDNTPPTIVITGSNPITISLGTTYNDAGATCTDNVDSSPTLTDTSTVDDSAAGSYTVTYTCTDDANNEAQAVRTVNVATIPGAPAGLRAIAGDGQVELSWRVPTNNGGAAIIDYIIQYSANAGASWTTFNDGTSTSTSATVTGLTNGQSYQFRASAVNSIGTGSTSNVAPATPTVTVQSTITAPGIPTSLSATAGNGEITLTWTAPADNGNSPIIDYVIDQSRDGGTTWVDSTPATSVGTTVTVTGLTNDILYQFRVSATNVHAPGAPSDVVSATPTATVQPVITAPGAPTNLSVDATGETTVTLSWTAPVDNGGSAITNYNIEQSEDGGTTWNNSNPVASITSSVTVTDLTSGQEYQFRVSATNVQHLGQPSNIVTATTTASTQQETETVITEPGVPTGLSATAGNTQVALSWIAPADTGSSAIIMYNIQQSTDGTTWGDSTPATATGLTQTVTGLTNGDTYHFRVSATNGELTGDWSVSVSATPNASLSMVPDAPKYPFFWLTADATEVRLFWSVPASDGGSSITSYKTQYRIATATSWTDGPIGLATPAIIKNLTPNQPYQFRVFAVNAIGTSESSLITSGTLVPRQTTLVPTPTTVPGAPTNLQANVGNGEVALSWTAPSDNGGSSITGYTVQQSVDSGTTWTASTFTLFGTTATATGLTNGEQYSFQVLAVNSIGISAPSNVITVTPTAQQTATVPDAPMYPFFWLTADATEVRLFWSPPTNDGGSEITSYKTQYRIATATSWTDGPTGLTVPAIIPNLTPNEPYQFRVFAINSIGTSESSLITSGTLVPRQATIQNMIYNTGSISLDKEIYPVPFANNAFNLHDAAAGDRTLPQGDVIIHVRVSDSDYDESVYSEDAIAEGVTGPVKVTVSRGSDSVVVATAGGTNVFEATSTTVKEYGPLTETAPDDGIFEVDIPVSYKDGPTNGCPAIYSSGCILQGDIITVEYKDSTDVSGEPNTVTDSSTFALRNAVLQSDQSVYIIGRDMILTLIEPDFDLDSDKSETYTLDLLEWSSNAATTSMGPLGTDAAAFDPEPPYFRETGDQTGIFQVVVKIPEALSGVELGQGEEIRLEYTDWGPSESDYVGEDDDDIRLTVFTSNS